MNWTRYLAGFALVATLLSATAPGTQANPPTPPEVWRDYDPDAGDFKEEIVLEETKDGVYYKDAYISAYVNGEEVRVFCKYAVKAGARKAPGLLDVHGWMGAPNIDMKYVDDGWAVMAHDYCGKTGNRSHYTKYPDASSWQHGCESRSANQVEDPRWQVHHRSQANG